MFCTVRVKRRARGLVLAGALALAVLVPVLSGVWAAGEEARRDFIKWVDFEAPESVLERALEVDVESHEEGQPVDWIDLLAYLAAKYGGDFKLYKQADFDSAVERLKAGEDLSETPSYSYYREAYGAVLGGFVGEFQVEGDEGWESCYGLKAYSPLAKTFPYSDYDDFAPC